MARQVALSIKLEDGTTAGSLAEVYGSVIENVTARAVSVQLKNYNLSGDPSAGSVEAKRLENVSVVAYGTARAAGAGAKPQIKPVTINLDQDIEIVTEIEAKDVKMYGLPSIMQRYALNHESAFIRKLDTDFFKIAYQAGAKVTTTATTEVGKMEELILALETVSNSFVDGITRDMMALTLTPTKHSKLRLEIDELPAQDNFYARGAVGLFHGVPVFVSNHLPKGVGQVVDAMVMAYGSVAQPVSISKAYEDEKIPLSNAHAVELFGSYGTKAVTEDLIFYLGDAYTA